MLNNFSIGKKLIVLLFIFIAGYAVFGLISFSTLNTLSINGNLHKQIIMSKDLIADVLPPPGYIIESYLDVLQLADESDSARMDYLYAELRRLQADYEERHQFWIHEPLLEEGALKDAMLEGAYEPAVQFYEIVFNRFIPALQSSNREQARELAQGELKTLYSIHRQSVDKVVQGATEKYEKTEAIAGMTVERDTKTLFIFALAIIAAAALIVFIIVRSITKPINMVVAALKDIAEGEGDLTQTITVRSKDEIGALARYFNKLMAKLHSTIKTTQTEAKNLSGTSASLLGLSENLLDSSETTFNQSITVSRESEDTSVNVDKIAGEAERASATATELSATVEQMGNNMHTMVEAVEEMHDSFNKITAGTRESKRVAGVATEKVAGAMDVMDALGASAKEIWQFTDVIKGIAKKTNLLAINATVEAARAGEAGKGFAVVAGEVKQLATQSASNADDITSRVENIQKSTAAAIDAIREISVIITKISESANSIAESIERQIKVSDNLAATARDTNAGAQEVVTAVNDVANSIQIVAKNAGEAADGAKNVSDSISVIHGDAEKTNAYSTELKEAANSLKVMAEDLDSLVSKFKT